MKAALLQVARLSREYATFNIDELESKMQRRLEVELDRQSHSFKSHKREVATQIAAVQAQLEQALKLKDSCV